MHYGSHALTLCVALACSFQVVGNMIGQVRVASDFFNNSPKCFGFLESQIKEILPNAKHSHLIDVCRTRWVARLDGLDVFAEVFVPLTQCLEAMKLNKDGVWNTEAVCDASGLFHSVTSFQFIVCLIVVSRCLEYTQALTKQLQFSTFDVVAASKKVALLYTALQRRRLEKSYYHEKWYSEAKSLAQSVNVDPSRPCMVHRQIHCVYSSLLRNILHQLREALAEKSAEHPTERPPWVTQFQSELTQVIKAKMLHGLKTLDQ